MGTGRDLRGRGDHRNQYEEAKRIQPDDHRLQAGRDRPHPHKVPLPFRPEHRRLPGDGADAEGQGIGVIFEKENINTLTESSEFLITLFSGFAQAESESLSSNIQLGIRMAMKEGKVNFHYRSMLGYQRGADGKPEIVPEEAEVVRRIYRRYLEGCSEGQIQRELTQDGIATAKGVKAWSHQIVHNILTNEKYAGDALLQKTFTTDCISKKVKKNTGELPQYYIKDNHPAIIPRDIYQRVQEEMARRTSKRKILQKSGKTEQGKYSAKYALSERLVCGECGSPISGVPGPGTASNGSSGGASPGWSLGKNTAMSRLPWRSTNCMPLFSRRSTG